MEADVDDVPVVFDVRFVVAFFAAPDLAAPSKIAPSAGGGMGTGCVWLGVDIWRLEDGLGSVDDTEKIICDCSRLTRGDDNSDSDAFPTLADRDGGGEPSPGPPESIGGVRIFLLDEPWKREL